MFQNAWWVGLPAGELEEKKIIQGDLNGRFAYYRCCFSLQEGARLALNITAGSRYRLWVNEGCVLSGPCKGDLYRWYFDTVDSGCVCVPGGVVKFRYENGRYTAVLPDGTTVTR